jgi:hypothetical protein
METNNKTNGAESYVIHPALARALVADGYDLGQIVSMVKAQKGRSKLTEASDKLGDVKIKEATESKSGQSSFTRQVKETYVNDLSAPMRFAAFTDGLATLFKKHGEPAFEITSAIIPAHLQVWIAAFKKADAPSDAGKPETNGKHGKRNKPVEALPATV